MNQSNQVERLTVLVAREDIKRIKHLAIERRESTSHIVRTAVQDFLKASEHVQQTSARK